MLNGTDSELADALYDDTNEEDDNVLTDQLLESDETVVCWTCGSQVSQEDIEGTLDRLWAYRQEKLSESHSIQNTTDETKD